MSFNTIHQQRRLLRDCGSLPLDVWARGSACAGWTNARVLAHLTAGAEFYRRAIVRALAGDATLSDAAAESLACFSIWQEQLARSPACVVLDQFAATGEELEAVFASLQPGDMDRPAWHPGGQVTVSTLWAYRAFELDVHGSQIRASVDPALRPAALSALALSGDHV
jgi:uncharacterized protein (TIGR03083 family)